MIRAGYLIHKNLYFKAWRRHLSNIYYQFYLFSVDGECVGLLDHGECHPQTGLCLCQAQRPVQIGATCVKGKFATFIRSMILYK